MIDLTKRAPALIVITVIYILAAVFGVMFYLFLPAYWPWQMKLLLADVVATVVVFAHSVMYDNASVYDPYWSVQPLVIAVAFTVSGEISGAGVLLLALLLVWGVRLTANWAINFHGFSYEDWRYKMFKENYKRLYPVINFFGIHLFPTLVVYACVLPAVYLIRAEQSINVGSVIFFVIGLIAVLLEFFADRQMRDFKKSRVGGLIRKGLWKYSRHPNYLGEITIWWAVAFSAFCVVPDKWYMLFVGALINTIMFLTVSIPMADKKNSVKTGYYEYKAETRMLLPIPRRQKGK